MGSAYKKVIGIGVSTILIPLGKWILGRIADKAGEKLASKSSSEEDYSQSAEEDARQYP